MIITASGMILTGKIIQQTNNEILFAGADSVRTLSREEAVQVYKTFSPEDDLALLAKLGIRAQSDKVRKDYQAGAETLERYISTGEIKASSPTETSRHLILISAFGGMNTGVLSHVLPWAGGAAVDYRYNGFGFSRAFRSSIGIAGYYAASGKRKLSGVGLMAGIGYAFSQSPLSPFIDVLGGMGIFEVTGKERSAVGLKIMAEGGAGIEYQGSDFFVSIAPVFVYIPDTEAPLQCGGIRIGAGHSF